MILAMMMSRKEVRMVLACAYIIVGIGVVIAVIRFLNTPNAARNFESGLAAVGLGAVVAMPGGLAFIAVKGRPTLLWVLGLILAPLSLLSFAGLLLPLLIPAFIFFRIALNHRSGDAKSKAVAVNVAVFVLMMAAVVSLFSTSDPREYYDEATGVYSSTSDEIAVHESVAALIFGTTALVVGARWAPRGSAQSNRDVQLGTTQ